MSQSETILVKGKGGLRGTIHLTPEQWSRSDRVPVLLERGGEVIVPASLLVKQEDGSVFLPLGPDEVERFRDHAGPIVVPLAREELRVDCRREETGKVVVQTTVQEREEVADLPLIEETVEVQRVPVGRIVDGPVPIREEGDVVVVPLLDEVLVVEKRLRLREELRIIRRRTEIHRPQRVTLRSEDATVERVTGPGGQPPLKPGVQGPAEANARDPVS